MILSDKAILEALEIKDIVITPFDCACLGSNSYDVHLSRFLAVYDARCFRCKSSQHSNTL